MPPAIERLTGARLKQAYVDGGYRGHGLKPTYRRPDLHRQPKAGRDSGDPVRTAAAGAILKADHRMGMGRNDLAHSPGDAINAILAAAGRQLPATDQLAHHDPLGFVAMGHRQPPTQ